MSTRRDDCSVFLRDMLSKFNGYPREPCDMYIVYSVCWHSGEFGRTEAMQVDAYCIRWVLSCAIYKWLHQHAQWRRMESHVQNEICVFVSAYSNSSKDSMKACFVRRASSASLRHGVEVEVGSISAQPSSLGSLSYRDGIMRHTCAIRTKRMFLQGKLLKLALHLPAGERHIYITAFNIPNTLFSLYSCYK